MKATELLSVIPGEAFQGTLRDIYLDESVLGHESERYARAVQSFVSQFGDGDLQIFSAPGRTEVCGNHTDHQQGEVLAASLNLDVIAVVRKETEPKIVIQSEGFPMDEVDISDLTKVPEEEGRSASLIRGVAAYYKEHGKEIGGFTAYTTSEVLKGSGMSSSAAFEVLVGTILSGLYGENDPVETAVASQYAENVYFGKPSGLLDQMACSVGGMVYMDFKTPGQPVVKRVDTRFEEFGHALCITDTKGDHANLTPDYAAVPKEMKDIAKFFGKDVLREVDEEEFTENIPALRKAAGDRAVLRAIHFFSEDRRVEQQYENLSRGDFDAFLAVENASGQSSLAYLQNIYSPSHPAEQGVSIGLAVSKKVLGDRGACRVHGGGFAGTIQAFVPTDLVEEYKKQLDAVFGEDSCRVLQIRPVGGIKVL